MLSPFFRRPEAILADPGISSGNQLPLSDVLLCSRPIVDLPSPARPRDEQASSSRHASSAATDATQKPQRRQPRRQRGPIILPRDPARLRPGSLGGWQPRGIYRVFCCPPVCSAAPPTGLRPGPSWPACTREASPCSQRSRDASSSSARSAATGGHPAAPSAPRSAGRPSSWPSPNRVGRRWPATFGSSRNAPRHPPFHRDARPRQRRPSPVARTSAALPRYCCAASSVSHQAETDVMAPKGPGCGLKFMA